jgi:hypothetical protein
MLFFVSFVSFVVHRGALILPPGHIEHTEAAKGRTEQWHGFLFNDAQLFPSHWYRIRHDCFSGSRNEVMKNSMQPFFPLRNVIPVVAL